VSLSRSQSFGWSCWPSGSQYWKSGRNCCCDGWRCRPLDCRCWLKNVFVKGPGGGDRPSDACVGGVPVIVRCPLGSVGGIPGRVSRAPGTVRHKPACVGREALSVSSSVQSDNGKAVPGAPETRDDGRVARGVFDACRTGELEADVESVRAHVIGLNLWLTRLNLRLSEVRLEVYALQLRLLLVKPQVVAQTSKWRGLGYDCRGSARSCTRPC
jgi:hypothetical protein